MVNGCSVELRHDLTQGVVVDSLGSDPWTIFLHKHFDHQGHKRLSGAEESA